MTGSILLTPTSVLSLPFPGTSQLQTADFPPGSMLPVKQIGQCPRAFQPSGFGGSSEHQVGESGMLGTRSAHRRPLHSYLAIVSTVSGKGHDQKPLPPGNRLCCQFYFQFLRQCVSCPHCHRGLRASDLLTIKPQASHRICSAVPLLL